MSASNGYSENPRSGWRPWLPRPSPPAEDRLIVGLEERRATAGDLRGGEPRPRLSLPESKIRPHHHRAPRARPIIFSQISERFRSAQG
jgi:hypothetical protein